MTLFGPEGDVIQIFTKDSDGTPCHELTYHHGRSWLRIYPYAGGFEVWTDEMEASGIGPSSIGKTADIWPLCRMIDIMAGRFLKWYDSRNG